MARTTLHRKGAMTADRQENQAASDPIQLLDKAGINLVEVIQAGWPEGVVFVPPAGIYYNVNTWSPEWVNALLAMGGSGEIVAKGILMMLMNTPSIEIGRVAMGKQLSRLVEPYFHGPN